MRMIKILSAALLSFAFIGASAQAYTVVTADQAVQTLLGPGVQYSNAQFTGMDYQLGTVTGGVAPMEVTSGIVLCTEIINVNSPGNFDLGPGEGLVTNEDLLNVANSVPPLIGQQFQVTSVHDLAILEFDFAATGNTLSFDYIFGSIEYFGFENTQFNDVFAFFLSGPGITGPYAAPAGFPDGAINVAIVPGSDPVLPITISSVNATLNPQYFIDNQEVQGINVDGLTTLLTVTNELICGETYHIALAIADCGDGNLHSTVILKEGSFNISGDLITPITEDPNNQFPDLTVVEGCIPGTFRILPPPCLVEVLTVNLNYSGTAMMGDDYDSSNPIELTFEPGVDEYEVIITSLDDDIQEGPESVTLSFLYTNVSGDEILESATIFIQDYDVNEPFITDIENEFICPGEVATITAIPNQGYPPYSYAWSTGATGPQQNFGLGSEGSYDVTLTDFCGYTWTEPFQIFEPDTFIVFPRTEICVSDIGSPVRGGLPPYTYVFEPNILIEETNTVLRSTVLGTTLITVTDACGQVRNGAVDIVTCEVPNVFSPNGDGQNEFFEIQGIDAYPNSKLQVWNRWGVLVYESENYENFWSAEEQPDGVYYFILQRADGKIINGEVTVTR